jgi:redox-sensing transcriptional repressor
LNSIDKVKGTFEHRTRDKKTQPSAATIRRLPRYYRYLTALLNDGILRISSSELAKKMNVTASQIRQDLSCFGDFGQQGYGYNVKYLYRKIGILLGLNAGYRAVLVGVGDMGHALLRSRMFARRGVRCMAAFDRDESLIGTSVGEIPIYDVAGLEAYCRSEKIDLAVLTLPADAAYEMARRLADAGVQGILNFTNTELPPDLPVTVQNVHLDDFLMILCYQMGTLAGEREDEDE